MQGKGCILPGPSRKNRAGEKAGGEQSKSIPFTIVRFGASAKGCRWLPEARLGRETDPTQSHEQGYIPDDILILANVTFFSTKLKDTMLRLF